MGADSCSSALGADACSTALGADALLGVKGGALEQASAPNAPERELAPNAVEQASAHEAQFQPLTAAARATQLAYDSATVVQKTQHGSENMASPEAKVQAVGSAQPSAPHQAVQHPPSRHAIPAAELQLVAASSNAVPAEELPHSLPGSVQQPVAVEQQQGPGSAVSESHAWSSADAQELSQLQQAATQIAPEPLHPATAAADSQLCCSIQLAAEAGTEEDEQLTQPALLLRSTPECVHQLQSHGAPTGTPYSSLRIATAESGTAAKRKPGVFAKLVFCTVTAPVLVPIVALGSCIQLTKEITDIMHDMMKYTA